MAKGPYETFGTDKEAETDGIDLDYGSFKIRVARAGGSNRKYQAALDARLRPYRRQIASGTLSEEIGEKVLREVFAETVVLSWDNVTDRKGDPIPFSRENVKKLFEDLPDLFADIRDACALSVNFNRDQQEDDAKKLPSGLSTNSE